MAATILAYRMALGALMLVITLQGRFAMRRTIYTIAAVYVFQLAMAALIWPADEWSVLMIGADAIACRVITWQPAGKMQSLVGMTFLLDIVVHVGRILNAPDADMNHYFWGLSILAFLQLALVFGWWGREKLSDIRRLRLDHPTAAYARRQGVE